MCSPVTLHEIQLLLTGTRLMTHYRYFKQEETSLPSLNGSLSKIVPSTSTSIVNREVKTLIEEAGTPGSKREN